MFDTLTIEEKRKRNARMEEIAQLFVNVIPRREPLDHVVLACASIIAASVAALPDSDRDDVLRKVIKYMKDRIALSDKGGHTEKARAALRRARH